MNIKFLKDEDGDDWDVGDTITIETEVKFSDVFDDEENLTDVDNVEITITGHDDNEVVSSESPQNHDTGQYFYEWDTTGLTPGDYKILVDASNSIGEKETAWIRLKN